MTEEKRRELKKAYPILHYFEYNHLPDKLKNVSKNFHDVAYSMANDCPYVPETSAGLRKLLEAKDCFVRSTIIIDLG